MENQQNSVLCESLFKNLLYFFETYHKKVSENSLIDGFPLCKNVRIPDLFSKYERIYFIH